MTGGGVGLALGAGGARGLAHIVALEALDDLGLRPSRIAGCSMGAVIGAAYCAGLSGRDLRAHALATLRDRAGAMARLLKARVGAWSDLFARGLGNPVLIDGEIVLDLFWPRGVPETFEELRIPLEVTATDYFARRAVVFGDGPLGPAVAASMAIPGLIRPVDHRGATLIDGGAVDPLPYGGLAGRCGLVVACDVAGGPVADGRRAPQPFEAMLGASQIMQGAITAGRIAAGPPDILLRPPVDGFRALDFFRAAQILRASEGLKEEIKRELGARLGARG